MNPLVTEEQFIETFHQQGGIAGLSQVLNMSVRAANERRRRIEARRGIKLISGKMPKDDFETLIRAHNARIEHKLTDGVIVAFSDCHYWPGPATTAHRAVVRFVKEMKPNIVVLNGDAFDGARISRHPKIGFLEKSPTVKEELQAVEERLAEVEAAAPKGALLVWTLGNHDLRYEARLAAAVPEFEGVHGFHLKDKFPRWKPCWGLHINPFDPSHTVIKHRWHGGIHATHNNVLKAGVNVVTGHTHNGNVRPYSDYHKYPRYGCDLGTISEPYAPQFVNYTEDNPSNIRSSFGVLTFKQGRLMMPQLVQKWDEDHVEYCGQIIHV